MPGPQTPTGLTHNPRLESGRIWLRARPRDSTSQSVGQRIPGDAFREDGTQTGFHWPKYAGLLRRPRHFGAAAPSHSSSTITQQQHHHTTIPYWSNAAPTPSESAIYRKAAAVPARSACPIARTLGGYRISPRRRTRRPVSRGLVRGARCEMPDKWTTPS